MYGFRIFGLSVSITTASSLSSTAALIGSDGVNKDCAADIPDVWASFGEKWAAATRVPAAQMDSLKFANEFAGSGIPVVIEGAANHWPAISTWTLEGFKERFKGQVRNRDITAGEPIFDDNGNWVGEFDGDLERLGLSTDEDTTNSFVSWLVLNNTISASLRKEYDQPAFLRRSRNSDPDLGPEYFFVAQQPSDGREPHIDYACESVWSAQISGEKRWRLLPPDAGVLDRDLGGIGGQGGGTTAARGLEAVLRPGDVLVFYPGWTHGTETLSKKSLSMSKQFSDPSSPEMFRQYRDQLRAHSNKFNSFSSCDWL